MDETRFTVFFEQPFWVGVFEKIENGRLSVCKVTFGAEPKDGELWDFILKHYSKLKFSPAVFTEQRQAPKNPKRRQREATRLLSSDGVGTKSQQALALQREQGKLARKKKSAEKREAERQRRFELKQQKRTEKHKGH